MAFQFSGLYYKPGFEKQFVRDDLRATLNEFGTYTSYFFGDNPNKADAEKQLAEILARTDVALTGWGTPMLPVSILSGRKPRLRYICNLTGSIKGWIPKAYLEAGIIVSNWGDGPIWYLAEGNLMLILALIREVSKLRKHMLEQPQWTYPYRDPSPTLRRKRVGIVGMGATARWLVALLKPFDCRIRAFDPYAPTLPEGVERCTSLEELFSSSDVVTLQCGLSEETTGMIGRALLDRLPRNAIFVNTARGKIVKEKELIEFLRDRPDVFAGLDVFEKEPLPKDSPLLQMDNVICYPHSVGAGGEAFYIDSSKYAADNIRAFCTGGKMKGVIPVEMYDRMT